MIMIIIRNTLFILEESVSIKNAGLNKMSNVFALTVSSLKTAG